MDIDELTTLAVATAGADSLAGLDAVARIRTEMERAEAVLVRRARNEGATWAQVAAALGVSKQAVHKKHGGRRILGGAS